MCVSTKFTHTHTHTLKIPCEYVPSSTQTKPNTNSSVSVQELQGLEQFIYADYANFIHVENVYESVLLKILDKEVTKGTRRCTDHTR